MAGRNAQFGGHIALFVALSLGAASTMAGYDVYSHDDTTLTFNLDVAAASFQGEDSWFGESSSFLGEPTNQWGEFGVEPRLSLETPLGGGTVFGQVSGVYTATFSDDASGLTIDSDSDDAQLEQGHLGWKTGELFGEGYTTSFSVGRQDYKIGSGMLIADGGSDGGEFGGWYLGMRKAFMESAIARIEGNGLLAGSLPHREPPASRRHPRQGLRRQPRVHLLRDHEARWHLDGRRCRNRPASTSWTSTTHASTGAARAHSKVSD